MLFVIPSTVIPSAVTPSAVALRVVRPRCRRRRPARAGSLVVLSGLLVAGCADPGAPAASERTFVTPLEETPGRSVDAAPAPSTLPRHDPSGHEAGEGTAAEQRAGLALLDEVLGAYSTALDRLVAHPAALEPGGAALTAWHEVVQAGTTLDHEVLEGVRRRLLDGVVVEPGPEGYAYRHRPVRILSAGPTAIDFTWCVHAPGVARRSADGVVVDDQVGHATGSGRVAAAPTGGWRLVALDQEQLRLLPAGEADPCV
jgi:hypothetical protein